MSRKFGISWPSYFSLFFFFFFRNCPWCLIWESIDGQSWFHDALLSEEHSGCSTYSRLLKTLIILMITALVRAVKGGSCLKNITTFRNDALINDTLNISEPSAQLMKANTILTVVIGWLSLQSSCCEFYGQTTTSEGVHMQSIRVLLERNFFKDFTLLSSW